MNTPRTLLAHLDASRAAAGRLAFASEVADRFDAQLDVGFAVGTRFTPLPLPGAEGVPPAPLMQEVDGRHRRRARAVHDQVLGRRALTRWIDLAGPDATERFIRSARVHDLVILGQRDPSDAAAVDVPADWVETVVLTAGVPVIVVPWTGGTLGGPDTVLVAWKSAAESARALASAWPVIGRAKRVHLAIASDTDDAEALAALMAAHGVPTVHVHRGLPDADAGNALLSLAADCGANLLVMGCYGHSRAREWALGGVSRTILASMTVPVWTAH